MRFVTFYELKPGKSSHYRAGLLDTDADQVIDLAQAAPQLPATVQALVAAGEETFTALRLALRSDSARLPLAAVKLLAPIPTPLRNILCVGKNYPAHVREIHSVVASARDVNGEAPQLPIIFTKATSSVTGPDSIIPAWLDDSASVDYEGELAVVIGRGGRRIPRHQAMEHIFGYTIVNDVTSRRMQKQHQQWFLGKSLDGFCPMGPSLVTRDEVEDVSTLRVKTFVNDQLRQDGCVGEMIFDIPQLIECLSKGMTLQSGDIIATGTPAGVGMGFTPPKFLKQGDRVRVQIDPLGVLENTVE